MPRTDNVRAVDKDGHFVGWLTPERAQVLADRGAGVYSGQGTRRGLVVLKRAVADYEDTHRPEDMKSTYTERIAGHDVVSIKRVLPGGSLGRYGNALTFDDLRAGRTKHKVSREELLASIERAA